MIRFESNASLNPAGKALTVDAWVKADKPGGVVVARGGPQDGFALTLEKGNPTFHVRSDKKLGTVTAEKKAGKNFPSRTSRASRALVASSGCQPKGTDAKR